MEVEKIIEKLNEVSSELFNLRESVNEDNQAWIWNLVDDARLYIDEMAEKIEEKS